MHMCTRLAYAMVMLICLHGGESSAYTANPIEMNFSSLAFVSISTAVGDSLVAEAHKNEFSTLLHSKALFECNKYFMFAAHGSVAPNSFLCSLLENSCKFPLFMSAWMLA